jgi:hypothetical protein
MLKQKRPGAWASAEAGTHVVAGKRYSPDSIAAGETLADLRFRRLVTQVHGLGARVLAQYLVELGAERLIRSEIESKLERFARLSPETLRARRRSLAASATAAVGAPASPRRVR